jgi:hypothetical protein
MATLASPRTSRNVVRRLAVVQPFDANGQNAEVSITLTRGKKTETSRYWIDRLPADWGRGFLVEKQGDGTTLNEEYCVNVNGQQSTCECLGFLRWGMGKDGAGCRHIGALLKLIELGEV